MQRQGARHRDALLLAARELLDEVVARLGEADGVQGGVGTDVGLLGGMPSTMRATWMFSRAVSGATRAMPCGTSMTSRAAASRSVRGPPAYVTVPLVGRSAPARIHSRVVLPAPDGPVSAVNVPERD